jgi:hypothetical protein
VLPVEPALEEVDENEQGEGNDQHAGGDHRGRAVLELLELLNDEQRQDFSFHRQVAGDENY